MFQLIIDYCGFNQHSYDAHSEEGARMLFNIISNHQAAGSVVIIDPNGEILEKFVHPRS